MSEENVQEKRIAFTVKRSDWLNANTVDLGKFSSSLYNPLVKRKCCLGFLCLAVGWTEADIAETNYPSMVGFEGTNLEEQQLVHNRLVQYVQVSQLKVRLENNIARINDDITLTEGEREAQLTEIFKEHGFDVTFVD